MQGLILVVLMHFFVIGWFWRKMCSIYKVGIYNNLDELEMNTPDRAAFNETWV